MKLLEFYNRTNVGNWTYCGINRDWKKTEDNIDADLCYFNINLSYVVMYPTKMIEDSFFHLLKPNNNNDIETVCVIKNAKVDRQITISDTNPYKLTDQLLKLENTGFFIKRPENFFTFNNISNNDFPKSKYNTMYDIFKTFKTYYTKWSERKAKLFKANNKYYNGLLRYTSTDELENLPYYQIIRTNEFVYPEITLTYENTNTVFKEIDLELLRKLGLESMKLGKTAFHYYYKWNGYYYYYQNKTLMDRCMSCKLVTTRQRWHYTSSSDIKAFWFDQPICYVCPYKKDTIKTIFETDTIYDLRKQKFYIHKVDVDKNFICNALRMGTCNCSHYTYEVRVMVPFPGTINGVGNVMHTTVKNFPIEINEELMFTDYLNDFIFKTEFGNFSNVLKYLHNKRVTKDILDI